MNTSKIIRLSRFVGSNDRDGKIDLYQWQQIKGPKVALDDANNIRASFISPQVNHDTILVFRLAIVDDNGGSNSAITTVRVIDTQESPNVPPKIRDPSISNPGDKSVEPGDVTNATGG
jgi:K319-like protein